MSSALAAVGSSNLPLKAKSGIRQWYDSLATTAHGPKTIAEKALAPIEAGGQAVVSGISAAATGILLSAIEAANGSLDIGKDKDVPLDGILGGIAYAASVGLANAPYGIPTALRSSGAGSIAILFKRKSDGFFSKHKPFAGHGDAKTSDDAILAAAGDL